MVRPHLGDHQDPTPWLVSPPQDSYMLQYFAALNQYLAVGVPTYFVTTGGYDFSSPAGTNGICSSAGCDPDSLT
ncbi:NPCL1 protein, partial [Centropus bengalensis]|nr:NPCL1 protein [Centropus bengalensis]